MTPLAGPIVRSPGGRHEEQESLQAKRSDV